MTKRRPTKCSRDPKAGPGSCWFWWEGCPEKVKDCFIRRARTADAAGEEARRAFLREVGLAE